LKYTIISDIHSNFIALSAFDKICDKDAILLCLGDIIGYGAQPVECIKYIRKIASIAVKGNHERMLINEQYKKFANPFAVAAIEWSEKVIPHNYRTYIEALSDKVELGADYLLVHGSVIHPDEYITSKSKARDSIVELKNAGRKIAFFGHTHIPGIYDSDGAFHYEEDKEIRLDKDRQYLINPGSIGQPRDRDPRASFCIFDTKEKSVIFHRFDYDIQKSASLIIEKGLPPSLGNRLFYGY
jgi:predicted phosphodiesterase